MFKDLALLKAYFVKVEEATEKSARYLQISKICFNENTYTLK